MEASLRPSSELGCGTMTTEANALRRTASIGELNGMVNDMSIARAGEMINLSNCNDENFIANAYKYCQKCLGGSWAKCSADKFQVQYFGYFGYFKNMCFCLPFLPNFPLKPMSENEMEKSVINYRHESL